MRKQALIVLALVAHVTAANNCGDKDAELSADKTSFYIPSRCTSLDIDGDHSRLDLLIAALDMHPSLTSLSLARDPWRAYTAGGVSHHDVDHLLEVLPNTNIENLNLAFNTNIGDQGVIAIAEALGQIPTLKSINLQTTGFEVAGLGALATSLKKDHSYLETLNIARNAIGDGQALLDAVKAHSHLQHINDEGTRLKSPESSVGHAVRTLLKGECVTSDWSDWSACQGACGAHNKVTRTRSLIHRPHERHLKSDESCPVELVDEKHCTVRCKHGKPIHNIKKAISHVSHHGENEQNDKKHNHHHHHHDKKHGGRSLLTDVIDKIEEIKTVMTEEAVMTEEVVEQVIEHVEEEVVGEEVVEEETKEIAEEVAAKSSFKIDIAAPMKFTRKV